MRWTYDPFQIRNAHFNLDVLGARGRWFAPDLYGPGADRRGRRVGPARGAAGPHEDVELELTEADWGILGGAGDRPWLALPSDPAAVHARGRRAGPPGASPTCSARGWSAESCRRLPNGTAVYLFGTVDDV